MFILHRTFKYCDKNFGLFSNPEKDIQLYIKLLDRFNARKISIRSCVLHIDNFFQHFCALFTRGKYNVKQEKIEQFIFSTAVMDCAHILMYQKWTIWYTTELILFEALSKSEWKHQFLANKLHFIHKLYFFSEWLVA